MQGPFGHRAWHAVESFCVSDNLDDSDADEPDGAMQTLWPSKLLLFGGETVNPESGDRMCTHMQALRAACARACANM